MASYLIHAVLWACMIPLCLVSTIVAIIALSHFRLIYRSLDVLFISFLSSLLINGAILIPLALSVIINNVTWSVELCKFFVWCFVTSRMVGLISLISISMDCLIMLRAPGIFRIYGLVRSKTIYIYVLCLWLLSMFTGSVPLIGWSGIKFVNSNNECFFMPYEIGSSFSIFVAVLEFTSVLLSVICITDSYFCLKHAKRSYSLKRASGRPPPPEMFKNPDGHPKSVILEALNFVGNAMDAWKVVLVVIIICFSINHIPFMVICVVGAVTPDAINHGTGMTIVLWLLLMENCILPHVLWAINKRYRHAFHFLIKICLCYNMEEYTDKICQIQLYHKRLQLTSLPRSRPSTIRSRASNTSHKSDASSYRRSSEVVDGDITIISHKVPNGNVNVKSRNTDHFDTVIEENEEASSVHQLETLPVRRTNPLRICKAAYTNSAYQIDENDKEVVQLTGFTNLSTPPAIVIYPDEDGTVRSLCTPVGSLPRTPSPDYSSHPHSRQQSSSSSSSNDSYNDSDIDNALTEIETEADIEPNPKTCNQQPRNLLTEQDKQTLHKRRRQLSSASSSDSSVEDNVSSSGGGKKKRKMSSDVEFQVEKTETLPYHVGHGVGEIVNGKQAIQTTKQHPETNSNPNKRNAIPTSANVWKNADKTLSLMEFLMTKGENMAYLDTGQHIYDSRYPLREEEEITAFI